MRRTSGALVCLDSDALVRLNRLRRGTHQPLSRFVNSIVRDFLDSTRSEPSGRRAILALRSRR